MSMENKGSEERVEESNKERGDFKEKILNSLKRYVRKGLKERRKNRIEKVKKISEMKRKLKETIQNGRQL